MVLRFAENKAILDILKILSKGQAKYTTMFKETKVSHTTLQRALNMLTSKKFVKKYNRGHMDVDYEITAKGEKLLKLLLELKGLL